MTSLPPADWMAALDGQLAVSLLTIPGTHDSGSRLGGARKQTQTLDIAGQLAAGIRFLDIRLKDDAGVFRLFHDDVDQQTEFVAGVLDPIGTFLADHPGEALVMSVKREGSSGEDATFARDFEALVAAGPETFHTGSDFPRLEDVRGKVVLVRRFAGGTSGVGAEPARWPENSTVTLESEAGTLTVEDHWDLGHSLTPYDDKWSAVAANLHAAAAAAASSGWFLTFTSAVHDVLCPRSLASLHLPVLPSDGVNDRVLAYLEAHPGHRRLGTLAMDFPERPDARLVQGLIDANL
jgi:1-phosphatidylinositol phosphodiesterase